MSKQKNLAELNAEKEKIEQQLAQEQHKKQRLKTESPTMSAATELNAHTT